MADNTMFINFQIAGYPEDVPDPFYARLSQMMSQQTRYNVVLRKMATFSLNNGDSKDITPASLALADWLVFYAKVIGTARIDTVGKDSDGTTTIHGYTPGYGTSIYPGYIILSTYNLTAITLTGLADGTVVELLAVTSQEDS